MTAITSAAGEWIGITITVNPIIMLVELVSMSYL